MKNATVIEKKEVKSEKLDLASINVLKNNLLSQAKKLNEKERSTKTKDKNFIYKFQLSETKISDKEQKKLRSKMRRTRTNLINAIIVSNNNPKNKELNFSACNAFISFYKENYILNDFSLKSLSNSKDEIEIEDLNFALNICKIYLEKK